MDGNGMIDDTLEPEQERTRWSIMPSVATFDDRLGNAAYRVLAVLASYSDKDGWCWPKVSAIASQLKVTRQAVQQHISQLEELEYVEVDRRTHEHGGYRSSGYRLMFDRWSARRTSSLQRLQDGLAEIARPAEGDSKSDLQRLQDELAPGKNKNTGTRTPEQEHRNTGALAAPKRPNGNPRVQAFHDEMAQRLPSCCELRWSIDGADAAAIKGSTAPPSDIAQAFIDLIDPHRGWGDKWLNEHRDVRSVIRNLNAWYNSDMRADRPTEFTQGKVYSNT